MKTFTFNINRHFDLDDQTAVQRIAHWIASNGDSPQWLKGLLWFILKEKFAYILPGHQLWGLLDQECQNTPAENFLIWNGDVKFDDNITVIQFGSIASDRESFLVECWNFKQLFFTDICESLQIKQLSDIDKMSKSEKEFAEKNMKGMIDASFLNVRSRKLNEINIATAILEGVIKEVYQERAQEESIQVTRTLAKSLAPTAAKLVIREVSGIVVKEIAKEIAKISAKHGGKSLAKKIPGVGLIIGAGLGLWRVAQGELGRGAMEVASGAASCVPGTGTAASLAIDAGIAGIDIAEAIKELGT